MFSSLARFLIGLFIFLVLSCMSCLYIFEISCSSVASFAIIFSHSEGCLFTLLTWTYPVESSVKHQGLTPGIWLLLIVFFILVFSSLIMICLLLLLLLSRFSCVRLCATPQTAAHQAPPSLGFSRQEHWSGLPFPSPRHESEK